MKNEINLEKPKKRIWLIILIAILSIIIAFYVYISQIEVNFLKVVEQPIVDEYLPDSYNGFKIAHFSDIHFGRTIFNDNLERVVTKINELNPDVVVFTGDLLDNYTNISESDIQGIKDNLKNINAKYRKYAITGDIDYVDINLYFEIMNDAGFIVLDNSYDLLYVKDTEPLMFLGTSSLLVDQMDLKKALDKDNVTEDYFKILLAHEPAIFDEINDIKINVILSGHTLGGLFNIGNYYLLQQDGINSYYEGFFKNSNGSKLYVCNGLGTYKLNIRLANVPSINFYRLYNN